jgi:hypothetical protein
MPAAADLLPLSADGWFNVVAGRCLYGATVDGMGGDGDDEVSAEGPPLQCLLLAISGCANARHYMRVSDGAVSREVQKTYWTCFPSACLADCLSSTPRRLGWRRT